MSTPTSSLNPRTTPGAHTTAVNGIDLYYETYGQGEPLVFLHGFTGAGSDWGHILKSPPEGYTSVIPDLRGHGRSTNPPLVFTHRESAKDIFALLDQLGIQRFKAIGLSTGAGILLHMATQQPARVDAMVLVSAAPYFPEQARAIMRKMIPERQAEADWNMMRQRHKYGDDQIRMLWAQGHAFKDSYDDINFTPPLLGTIQARTLIVHGDRDPFYPASLALELYKSIENSYLWILPNAGHVPIFGAMSATFIETALGFLGGAWESR
jgi:pimeloyl-ACP methyl ester carboxylesterase